MNRIEVYEFDEVDFINKNAAGIISNPLNLKISKNLNGDWRVNFTILLVGEERKSIKIRSIVKVDDQLYRVTEINDSTDSYTSDVVCRHIFFDSEGIHISDTDSFEGSLNGDIVNTTALYILEQAFKGTKYNVLSNSRAIALGMENVSKGIDFWRMKKTNPCEICEKLLTLLGKGQLYIDNLTIGIVERIGEDKSDKVILRKDKNITALSRTSASDNLITRLYPFGESDLSLESGYIDSIAGIERYGVIEGFKDYSNINNPAQLEEAAVWEFSPENMYRIDRPNISYSFNFIDLKKLGYSDEEINLGDIVTIYDGDLEVYENLTVTSKEEFPMEAESGNVKIGNPVITLGQLLAVTKKTVKSYHGNINKYGDVKVDVKSPAFYNQIVDVVRQDVVAADVIEATSAFIEDLFVERLETNLNGIKCVPNIIKNEEGGYEWIGGEKGYIIPNVSGNIRAYIKAEGISLKFIEAHLTENSVKPLIINERQVYYTSIADAENAYEYFTFINPKEKYPDMSDENAEMFKVMIRASENEYTKAEFRFNNSGSTFEPKLMFGVGINNYDDKGKFIFEKNNEYGIFYYLSENGVDKIGVRVSENGVEYYDIESNEWKGISGGSGSDYYVSREELTQEEIDGLPEGQAVFIYDVENIYIPE